MRQAPPPVAIEVPSRGSAELIYRDELVAISPTIAVFHGVTYPISGISSLGIATKPRNRGLKIVSAVCGIGGVVALSYDIDVAAVWLLVLCGMLAAGAYLTGPLYSLLLRTRTGEVAALRDVDPIYVRRVRASLETAIAAHGQDRAYPAR